MTYRFPTSTSTQPETQPDLRQLLEQLYKGRSLLSFKAGHPIRMMPNEILVVCRGVVQLSTLYPNGEEALLGLATPSMPFGLPITITRPYSATALSNVDVMRLSWTDVMRSPQLSQSVLQQMSRRVQQAEAMLAVIGNRRVEDRLKSFLLLLKDEVGQPVYGGGVRLNVRLTHQQLANAIGTTRVTVTRLLSQLQDQHWLQIDGSRHICWA
jgi:CRP-like cAMP-binding protein